MYNVGGLHRVLLMRGEEWRRERIPDTTANFTSISEEEKGREAREEETKPSHRFHAPFTRPSCGKFRKKALASAVLMKARSLFRRRG